MLSASFVDDGICGKKASRHISGFLVLTCLSARLRFDLCASLYRYTDCCDGTDELKGCSNTCIEKSAGALLELQQKVAAYSNTLAKKASYVHQAAERRKNWAARTHTIDSEITAKMIDVEIVRSTFWALCILPCRLSCCHADSL